MTAAESTAASALASHEADTTNIHGIANTALLVTTTGTQTLTNKTIDTGTFNKKSTFENHKLRKSPCYKEFNNSNLNDKLAPKTPSRTILHPNNNENNITHLVKSQQKEEKTIKPNMIKEQSSSQNRNEETKKLIEDGSDKIKQTRRAYDNIKEKLGFIPRLFQRIDNLQRLVYTGVGFCIAVPIIIEIIRIFMEKK